MSAAEANPTEPTFEQLLQTAEEKVTQLKTRYQQVQTDQARQTELTDRKAAINATSSPELTEELNAIETELHELEVRLESQLFSWDSWKQYFWQTVRFVGIGIAIGWGMAFYIMKHPTPNAIEPNQPNRIQ
jgi:chromosome segregation ATPase